MPRPIRVQRYGAGPHIRPTLLLFALIVGTAITVAPPTRAATRAASPSGGAIASWGYNAQGQLGNNSTASSSTPVPVGGLTAVTQVAAGDSHSLALQSDGTVWAWGYNAFGQLGSATTAVCGQYATPCSTTPIQVPGVTGIVAIAAGAYHSLALKGDGTVWAWGDDQQAQLGDGNSTICHSWTPFCSDTPVQVRGLTGVVAIAAGAYHSLALKGDGTVWTWGFSNFYQLGATGAQRCMLPDAFGYTPPCSTSPVQVPGLSGVVAIAGGTYHSLALKGDGTVWAWGDNAAGQLGAPATQTCGGYGTSCSMAPVQVQGLAGVTDIASGGSHSLAITNDGTVWAWGLNASGQLGIGTTSTTGCKCSTTPVQVTGLSQAASVAGGGAFSVALDNAGHVWTWGLNAGGQLGNASTTSSSVPIQISSGGAVADISAGSNHVLAASGIPHLRRLSPIAVGAGTGAFTLTVVGGGFASGATVLWNGSPRPTTVVSTDEVTAAISGGDIATPGTGQITVTNPGSAPSNPARLAIQGPKVAVILVMGMSSSIPAGNGDEDRTATFAFNPLAPGAYNDLANASNSLLSDIGKYFDVSGGASPNLTDSLVGQGAVLLPFSYNGARLRANPSTGLTSLSAVNYSQGTPGQTLPGAAARTLANEVASVHAAWPTTPIVIVGHSEGGLVAETYYQMYHASLASSGVTKIFSLDGPINGIGNPIHICEVLGPLCQAAIHVGPVVATAFDQLYHHMTQTYQTLSTLDGDGTYQAFGTAGDLLFDLGDFPDGGLSSQLAFDTGSSICDGGPDTCPEAYPPDDTTFEPPDPPDLFSSLNPMDSVNGSHFFVVGSRSVITAITRAVGAAAAGSSPLQAVAAARSMAVAPAIAGPHGRIAADVLTPGQSITINGTGLGTTQGQIQFTSADGQPALGVVTGWTDTQVSLTVPSNVATGIVEAKPATGQAVLVGAVTVLGTANGVASLQAQAANAPALDGRQTTVAVTALDASQQPVPNVGVSLSDGMATQTAQTNAAGVATFTVTGYGTQKYEAFSGNAWTPVTVTWQLPPPMTVALSPVDSTANVGEAVTLSATVTDASGAPVPNQPVNFTLNGPASATLTSSQVTTNAQGVATTTVTDTSDDQVVVTALTDDDAAGQATSITWIPQTRAPLTITAGSASMTYGDAAPPSISPTYDGFINGGGASALAARPTCGAVDGNNNPMTISPATPAGVYTTTCSGAAASNYIFTYKTGTLTVGKATLTVTANDKSMLYGGTAPGFAASYAGFKNGDSASGALSGSPDCTSSGGSGSPAGQYPIVCTLGTLSAANYTFAFMPGQLTVTSAPLTITASSLQMTLHGSVPALVARYSGFVNGDTSAALTVLPTCGTTATSGSPAGSYPITCAGAVDPNYAMSYLPGTLWVRYKWSGFSPPINDPAAGSTTMSVFNAGRTIPAIFQLKDAQGRVVQAGSLPIFSVSALQPCPGGVAQVNTSPAAGSASSTYRWDSTDHQYIYNYTSPGSAAGMCQSIRAMLDDGTTQSVYISYK